MLFKQNEIQKQITDMIIPILQILQIVFRPEKLIKANYKPSKMKVLKDIFQQSFKLPNYWEKHTHVHKRNALFLKTVLDNKKKT